MVRVYETIPYRLDGSIDVNAWIEKLKLSEDQVNLLQMICQFALEIKDLSHQSACLIKGLEMAQILYDLGLDIESMGAAILYAISEYVSMTGNDKTMCLNPTIILLVKNTQDLNTLIQKQQYPYNTQQVTNLRKMLFAVVRDIRVIVMKLAERLWMLQKLRHTHHKKVLTFAQETMTVFVPLASRLGLYQMKWELEDLSFLHTDPTTYERIAHHLAERRQDREKRVETLKNMLEKLLKSSGISAEIQGRAKHIYSIQRKMQQKKVPLSEIYDAVALRILVSDIEACYATLSVIHEYFQPIAKEFDDYIAKPKPNGYQSLHTAVIDNNGKAFEVQIRTIEMHEYSERGMAAHWIYKEQGQLHDHADQKKKVALKDLLEWQKNWAKNNPFFKGLTKNLFSHRIYVFTPLGEMIDLPQGSTPLDFAYAIHTELGHQCRGAKINQKIVPLTTPLKMGDSVEILKDSKHHPSRDWLLPQKNYLKTSRARTKVRQWFKQYDFIRQVEEGKIWFDRECRRLCLDSVDYAEIAKKLQFRSTDFMFAAFYRGDLKWSTLLNVLLSKSKVHFTETPVKKVSPSQHSKKINLVSQKENNILMPKVGKICFYRAQCCCPIPGDLIVGYITRIRGVAIHRENCSNIIRLSKEKRAQVTDVYWENEALKKYTVELTLLTDCDHNLSQVVVEMLSNQEIDIIDFQTIFDQKLQRMRLNLIVMVSHSAVLSELMQQLLNIPAVHSVKRK